MTTEPIGILGAGWVGLVTGACLAELGCDVVVRDVVEARVASLEAGDIPIHEPGLSELIARNRPRLKFENGNSPDRFGVHRHLRGMPKGQLHH